MTRIVVVGAGIGGVPMAFELREMLGKSAEIAVVSNSEWFQFVPSNPWVAVNWRKPEDIQVHLPKVFGRLGISFSASGVKQVRPAENAVVLNDGTRQTYDYLVIATGPKLAFDEIEGLGPGGHTGSICEVGHAAAACRRWEEFCRNPGPLVVGAVQGASCFGPAYEFAMLASADLRKRKIRNRVPMTFVTSEPYIGHLGLGGVGDTKGVLESELRNRDVRWITNATVDRVTADTVEVTEVSEDGTVKRQQGLPAKLAMFMPAFRGADCLRDDGGMD
jgi:sulfide:quinone oxidoreductase